MRLTFRTSCRGIGLVFRPGRVPDKRKMTYTIEPLYGPSNNESQPDAINSAGDVAGLAGVENIFEIVT